MYLYLHYYFVQVFTIILLYMVGFLSVNDLIIQPSNLECPTRISLKQEYAFTPHFDKAVLIVIDALRSDFVQNHTMPFTTATADMEGCTIGVKVDCPTVTLPRIKSLTVGNIPQYMDILFNLVSGAQIPDSLLHSLHLQKKRIVFYGDDTWLKLFPSLFHRYEGTSSFFVNDFYEVDNNVTRNVKRELNREDWDVMILHYLGLDHIGHVYGPSSPLIPKKLQEMDEIIKLIHSRTMVSEESNMLMVITGDHGMKDSGGHGGASFSETNVPLIMLGLSCESDSISQTDIPANLAALLGVDLPSPSIGLMHRSMLKKFTNEQYLFALRLNTLSLLQKKNMCNDHFDLATSYHKLYLRNKDDFIAHKAIHLYQNCSQMIQEYMVKTSTPHDAKPFIVLLLILIYTFFYIADFYMEKRIFDIPVTNTLCNNTLIAVGVIFLCLLLRSTEAFIFIMSALITRELQNSFRLFYKHVYVVHLSPEYLFLIALTVLHPFTLMSSSFIEEEHQYWYHSITSFIYLCLVRVKGRYGISINTVFRWICLLILVRFLRSMNQTGDKWASLPDLADWFAKEDNFKFLCLYVVICLVTIYFIIFSWRSKIPSFITFVIFILVAHNHFVDGNRVLVQRYIWFLIFFHGTILQWYYKGQREIVWIEICTLLFKPDNLGLIILCLVASKLFAKFRDIDFATLCHLWLGKTLFFMQGHSNSIANIDISPGYIGLHSYNPFLVALQVSCHTYAMPILSLILLLNKFKSYKGYYYDGRNRIWWTLYLHQLLTIIVVFSIALIQRHHLFIWSVFTPKCLIESLHYVALYINFLCFRKD